MPTRSNQNPAMTFEEFRTAHRRQQSTERAEETDIAEQASKEIALKNSRGAPSAADNEQAEKDSSQSTKKYSPRRWRKWKRSLECRIEAPYVKILVLALIYLDILFGLWYIVAQINDDKNKSWISFIGLILNIILYLHCVELLLQMTIFHVRLFSHWGYAIDTFIIVTHTLKRHSAWNDANYY